MRRTGLAILSCLVLFLAQGAQAAEFEVTALKIFNKSFDSQAGQLGYELWNESDKTITAWRLSLARSDPQGNGQSSTLDQDYFDRQPAVELGADRGPIAPGASVAANWRLELDKKKAEFGALSLRVVAVVFDDLTWQGDPEAASIILASRQARVEEIGRVLEDLEKQNLRSFTGRDWSATFKQSARQLRLEGGDPESAPGRRREVAAVLSVTKLELAQWLEDASREIDLSPDPEEAVGYLTGSLRARYQSGLDATLGEGRNGDEVNAENGGER